MTIDKMIQELEKMRAKIGGEHEVPVVRINYGENDYIIPDFGTIGDFVDQDGYEFKCALVGEMGGEEFTSEDVGHWKWKPKKIK